MIQTEDQALRLQQIRKFNQTEADFSSDMTVVAWIEASARQTPDHPAVYDGDNVYSYDQLNRDANRLAHALMDRHVGPGAIVAILMPRSYSMMVCVYGIFKAGAAYLPLDPNYPSARLGKMLEDSAATIVLTAEDEMKLGDEEMKVGGTSLSALDLSSYSDVNPGRQAQPKDLAYLIYTSGSTGDPKGVLVEHRALMNRLEWMQKNFPITSADTLFQKTVYTFDVSVWELIWWTVAGASVVLLPPGKENDPRRFVKLIEKRGISVIHFVPAVLRLLLDYIESDFDLTRLRSLRYVFCSGEELTSDLVGRFYNLFPDNHTIPVINLYGPTEATIDVSCYVCEPGQARLSIPIPIGKPIDNTRFYILREDGTLASAGEHGQLYVAGTGLARGYLNNPRLTHERFVPNPYEPGERMYRTGDLAYWNDKGEVIYKGREDHQIKLRGLRIELGEIEQSLMKCEQVRDAVAGVYYNKVGDQLLIAYVTGEACPEPELQSILQNRLTLELPIYAIPVRIIRLDEMPLKPNGKIDRGWLFSNLRETADHG